MPSVGCSTPRETNKLWKSATRPVRSRDVCSPSSRRFDVRPPSKADARVAEQQLPVYKYRHPTPLPRVCLTAKKRKKKKRRRKRKKKEELVMVNSRRPR
ncbi:hypothetical protein LZ31DRAFT_159602 [Colletotrichum somersetense]|nr:hypothetical protein LZ31DRAFT_159602 [Colletotrichum somersetense]